MEITGTSIRLESAPSRRQKSRHAARFRLVRDSAKSAYGVLERSMRCYSRCQALHTMSLCLEARAVDDTEEEQFREQLRFRVVFTYSKDVSRMSIAPWRHEEADIKILSNHQNPERSIGQGSLPIGQARSETEADVPFPPVHPSSSSPPAQPSLRRVQGSVVRTQMLINTRQVSNEYSTLR